MTPLTCAEPQTYYTGKDQGVDTKEALKVTKSQTQCRDLRFLLCLYRNTEVSKDNMQLSPEKFCFIWLTYTKWFKCKTVTLLGFYTNSQRSAVLCQTGLKMSQKFLLFRMSDHRWVKLKGVCVCVCAELQCCVLGSVCATSGNRKCV